MTGKDFYQEDYDEYIENTPLEARFDPLTIQAICVEAIPKHAAYGMMFEDYQKQRGRFSGYDTAEKIRLSFYVPSFHARIAADLAILHDTSRYHFMILVIELGLITFQHDHYEDYAAIKKGRQTLFKSLTTEYNQSLYMQLDQHAIELCSSSGAKIGKSKNFTPTVPEWLYNTVSDVASNLNMSTSDFVFLCWCIGAKASIPESSIPEIVGKDLSAIILRFHMGIDGYTFQIKSTIERMQKSSSITTSEH